MEQNILTIENFCISDFPEELLVPIFASLDLGDNPVKFIALKLCCSKFVRIFDSHWEISESVYSQNFGWPSSTVRFVCFRRLDIAAC
jgi:hypothetical protein